MYKLILIFEKTNTNSLYFSCRCFYGKNFKYTYQISIFM